MDVYSPFAGNCNSNQACSDVCEKSGQIQQAGDIVEILIGTATMITLQVANFGSGTILFEISVDGVTWLQAKMWNIMGGNAVSETITNGVWQGSVTGFKSFRARADADYLGTFADILLRTSGGSMITFQGGAGGGGILAAPVIIPTRFIDVGSAVTMTADDCEVVIRKTIGGPTVVVLPPDAIPGQYVRVSDGKGDANENPISVSSPVGTINGQSGSLTMDGAWATTGFTALSPTDWKMIP